MNEVLKAIGARYSCRGYTDRVPSAADLRLIANAAIQAPSGMNRQHWHILVIGNKTLIDEMDAEGMKNLAVMSDKSMYERIMSRGGRLFYNAPRMIIVAVKEASPKGAELFDGGIVAQNIVLAATSLGIDNLHCGLVGFSFAGDRAEEFKKRIMLPDGYGIGIAVLLGYAEKPGTPHTPDLSKITMVE